MGSIRIWSCSLAALLLWSACGCQGMPPVATRPLPAGATYLVHLPGVAGDSPFDRWWIEALKDGGAADDVELYDWTCNDPWIHALQAYDRNHQQAARVANLIVARLRADPQARVILTAESGGTGIAIWALESLPKDLRIQTLLMLAPAISPRYDLTAALRHVSGKAYAFTSAGDVIILGAGTRLFGTMDGKKTEAAGLVGFRAPPAASPDEYRKLIQIKYDPAWMIWGNFGSHAGGMSATFARHVLAPLLLRHDSPVGIEDRRG